MPDLKPNPIITAWNEGRLPICAWNIIPSTLVCETLALLPFDAVTVDMQHSIYDLQTLTALIAATNAAGKQALVRVPWNADPGLIMRVIDFGVAGMICPSVSNAAEAAEFVRSCRYPPIGNRNFNYPRASQYQTHADTYFLQAHDRELVIVMIESVEGMECLDEIAATPGLDMLQLGPADLILSRFGFGSDPEAAASYIADAHRRLIEAARRHGKRTAATSDSPARLRQLQAMGYDLLFLGCDLFDMRNQYLSMLDQLAATEPPAV